jgi:predicted dehydrogenase
MAAPFPETKPLKLALIGAGAMGANYVKAVQSLSDVRIAAVIDQSVERANQVGAVIGARAAASLAYAGDVQGVIVAAPSAAHHSIAEPLLASGMPCLIEKPFALTEEDCRALMAAAARGRACLQVGHVERFNAAVQAILVAAPPASEMRLLTGRRMNAGSARVTDIDVVMDLMVHDIDVVMALKRVPVAAVRAFGTNDHAEAVLTFADETEARLTASRVTEGRTRDLTVEMKDGAVFAIDYIQRTLNHSGVPLPVTGDANNLGRQMMDFARAIRTGAAPQVDGAQALAVMDTAWRVQKALGLS